jgi:hypothetical protein
MGELARCLVEANTLSLGYPLKAGGQNTNALRDNTRALPPLLRKLGTPCPREAGEGVAGVRNEPGTQPLGDGGRDTRPSWRTLRA